MGLAANGDRERKTQSGSDISQGSNWKSFSVSVTAIETRFETAPPVRLDEPLYIASDESKLFGWLHRSAGERPSEVGLVICKPFGYEALCSHRSVRTFAEAIADLGIPVLRFDYLGAGDSADIDAESDQVVTWTHDTLAAVDALRQRTGVARVYLLGFRLGALLATMAAASCEHVDGLVLVAPVISGRRYLRELRTTRLVALLAADGTPAGTDADRGGAAASDGSMEISGYTLSGATIAALSKIDLMTLAAPLVSRVLIIDRSDLPAAEACNQVLARLGVRSEYIAFPGFVEMMLTAPQFAAVPRAMVAATTQWLSRMPPTSNIPSRQGGPWSHRGLACQLTTGIQLSHESSSSDATVIERPFQFGAEARLFGIVTEPERGETPRRAVILLNAAADQHMGASRMNVSLARRWARRGYLVLRMDLAGLGDSGTRPGRPDDEVFPPAANEDILDAIELIHTRYGIRDITLTGLCSGAYHALRAAVAGLPVSRILMVNPQNYFWKEGTPLQDLQLAEVVRNPTVYRERVLSIGAWKRLLAGRVGVWRIAQIYFHRAVLTVESALRDLARSLRIHLPRDLGWELERIVARDVRLVLVFARGEAGIDLLKIQAGSAIKRLGIRCRVHIIEGGDHTFSHGPSRAALEEVLSGELFARHETVEDRQERPG